MVFDPFGAALCLILLGLFFARVIRRSKYMTLVDFFDSRYGGKVAGLSAFIMLIAEMGWIGALLFGFGAIVNFFTGVSLGWGIGISTLVLILYTHMGGMYAVTLTDSVHIAVVTVSMIAAFKLYPGMDFDKVQNQMLLYLAADYLPSFFVIIFACGLVAAPMSSAAAASLVVALKFTTIYNLMVVAWTLLVSNFLPYAAGSFWEKANTPGSLAAMIGGFMGWTADYFHYLPLTSRANTGIVPDVEGV
ncbi:Sodium:solute symporter family protein [Paracoccus halophilus]|uniref:Sodium:solute symporter family protein n=1 Tax=Paracoccus halophilus TaxID=376733 RepID=A0A099F432_9RHOB|nr:hypothetical protein [Paracoccus halophilus]KGJ05013.1 hypothetical protein IT41_08335 [Paracoccus halophilus]SFA39779.1 Sodium:solute symporter family protein [Paracoccus halophilus]